MEYNDSSESSDSDRESLNLAETHVMYTTMQNQSSQIASESISEDLDSKNFLGGR